MPQDSRITEIYEQVVSLPLDQRDEALQRLCGGDTELRQQVQGLLAEQVDTNDFGPYGANAAGNYPEFATALPSNPFVTSAADPSNASVGSEAETADLPSNTHHNSNVIAGRYHLQAKLGEGGMGEVWRAQQSSPVKRLVAVKLIKTGMDSRALLQRFDQERQALAMMDHPNIAKVLDGGVSEAGHPYFVMDLVNGVPLTEFADRAQLNPRERLELFRPICNAIQHAHQKGIVHRDLKPANILVAMVDGKPIPKVIDFGVAKATGGKLTEQTLSTQFGAVIGTLEYMSPEQAGYMGSDVDTRADIYSLGVVLYELLTGLRPHDTRQLQRAGIAEIIRMVQEAQPSKPSTRLSTCDSLASIAAVRKIDPRKLTILLRGDLDCVVMKCLEKERDRRYESASALGNDISRYLANEPVDAKPASTSYRVRKFVQRNRGPFVAAGLLLAAVLVGFAGTAWGMFEARRQAEVARQETERKEQALAEEAVQRIRAEQSEQVAKNESAIQKAINRFLREDILAQASAFTQSDSIFQPDPDLTVKQALDRASERIGQRFEDQPLIEAAIRRTIGTAYADLGVYPDSQHHLENSLSFSRQHLGDQHPDTIETLSRLGSVMIDLDRLNEAEKLLTDARNASTKLFGQDHRSTLLAELNLGLCYQAQAVRSGQPEKSTTAEALFRYVLENSRRLFGDNDILAKASLTSLATLYRHQGSDRNNNKALDKAEETILQVLKLDENVVDEDPRKLNYLSIWALINADKLDFPKALKIRERVLKGCIQSFGEIHPNTARAMDGLANTYTLISKHEEAEKLLLKSLQIRRQLYGNGHHVTQHAVFSLGQFYYNCGNWEKAEIYYRERFDHSESSGEKNQLGTHLAGRDLALILMNLDQQDEAATLLEDAIAGMKIYKPENDPIVMLTREYQADLFMRMKRFDEAIAIYQDSVAVLQSQPTPPPIELGSSFAGLGQALLMNGQYAEAEDAYKQSTDLFRKYIPDAWPTHVYQVQMGVAIQNQGNFESAEKVMLAAFEKMRRIEFSVPRELWVESIECIIKLYEDRQNSDEAEKWKAVLLAAKPESVT